MFWFLVNSLNYALHRDHKIIIFDIGNVEILVKMENDVSANNTFLFKIFVCRSMNCLAKIMEGSGSQTHLELYVGELLRTLVDWNISNW